MHKDLIHNQEDYNSIVELWKGFNVRWNIEKPEKFPCVIVGNQIINNNGADTFEGGIVYLEDFNPE